MPRSAQGLSGSSSPVTPHTPQRSEPSSSSAEASTSRSAPRPAGSPELQALKAARPSFKAKLAKMAEPKATIKADYHELGAYMLLRHLNNRPMYRDDLRDLIAAQTTMNETRAALSGGRGNVKEDDAKTNGIAEKRTRANRTFARGTLDKQTKNAGQPLSAYNMSVNTAASAMLFEAGNCGEHSKVNSFLHTKRMQPDHTMQVMAATNADHVWAQVHRPGNSPIVMDTWKDGPAVLREDATSYSGDGEPSFELAANPAFRKQVETLVSRHKPQVQQELPSRLAAEWMKWSKSSSQSVVSRSLSFVVRYPTDRARATMKSVWQAVREADNTGVTAPTPSLLRRIFRPSTPEVQAYHADQQKEQAAEATRRTAMQVKRRVGHALGGMNVASQMLGKAPTLALDSTGKPQQTGRVAALATNANGIIGAMDKLVKR